MSKKQALIGGLVLLTICSLFGFLNAASKGASPIVLSGLGLCAIVSISGALLLHNKNRLAH